MIECNFNVEGDLLGLSSEVANLTSDEVTLLDGSVHKVVDGSTFLAVDTGDLYILYQGIWYKL